MYCFGISGNWVWKIFFNPDNKIIDSGRQSFETVFNRIDPSNSSFTTAGGSFNLHIGSVWVKKNNSNK